MICTLKSLYFFDESDTESAQEVSRSPVRVRRMEDLDSQPSQNLLARARWPIRGVYFCTCVLAF